MEFPLELLLRRLMAFTISMDLMPPLVDIQTFPFPKGISKNQSSEISLIIMR